MVCLIGLIPEQSACGSSKDYKGGGGGYTGRILPKVETLPLTLPFFYRKGTPFDPSVYLPEKMEPLPYTYRATFNERFTCIEKPLKILLINE